jgi:hypothetical protein
MAVRRPFSEIVPLSHLPTWFFIIGYPLFWLQLYTHTASHGITTVWSWILWGAIASVAFCFKRSNLLKTRLLRRFAPRNDTIFWFIGFGIALFIILIVALASLKPIHLLQESDCMQYHYTLPRQHLILGSFAHIPWAADDLFLLPMEFALAPFWFATALPNKIPQFIIFLGLIAVAMRLTCALAGPLCPWVGPFVALVILGTHGFGIQMGTGMLDLAIGYLFLASLDSLRLGNWFLAAVEFTFFFWSKSLMPLEVFLILGILFSLYAIARLNHWQIINTFTFKHWRQALGLVILLSAFIGGPFVVKSIYYAGTPLFPLGPGLMQGAQIKSHPEAWQSLQAASRSWLEGTKNSYGHGRGLVSFIKHWWLVSVPENGVNNAFDYPLGLTYLLMIGPFLFFLVKDISQRKFSPLGVLAAVIWALWWFEAQQSRFLYVPLLLIFTVTIARLEKISKMLFAGILISLFLQTVSLWGAHKADMSKWGADTLRSQDKQLLELNRRYVDHSLSVYVDWPSHDVAYAQFPVMVHKENLPHTTLF